MYIGTPPSNAFTSLLKQDFSTSATTGYTLDHAVNNANDIALFINFVRQEPTAGYAASGTTLTLTSATASSDDMYCVYLGQALQTVNPPNGSVGLSQLTATGTKDATTFLRGDNTFASAGGDNTPAFLVKLSADVNNQAGDSTVKVPYNTEIYDTDNAYDNSSNYRFTVPSGKGGKYYIFIHQHLRDQDANDDNSRLSARIYKNGSFFSEHQLAAPNGTNIFAGNLSNYVSFGINMDLAAGNYIEFFCKVYSNNFRFMEEGSYAGGFKLI